MLKAHGRKHPVSVYKVGEKVVIQNLNAKSRRGKLKFGEPEGCKGVVLEAKEFSYRV